MVRKTSVSAVETARRGLCQMIATGELPAGAPLPSEAYLCERFGVSRSSLREAQRMLTVAGALRRPARQQRRGVRHVGAADDVGLEMVALLLPLERYLELFMLREVLEGHVSAQAAARMTEKEAAELLRVAQELAQCEPTDRAQLLDTRFHTLISEAAGDEVLTALLETIRRRGRDYRVFEDGVHYDLKTVSDDAHIEIARAIQRRDPEGARALAMHHVRVTRSWLEEIRPGPVLFEHF